MKQEQKEMKVLELQINSKKEKSKDGKKTWIKYWTYYMFKNADGTRTRKGINVQFTEDAFAKCDVTLKNIKRGILKVNASCVGCPDTYEITKDENGKNVYPVCWIRDNGVLEYIEQLVEHEFHFAPVSENEQDTEETDLPVDED